MKRESIHSGQRVRYSDGKPSGVWTVVAIEEQVVLQAASGRRLAQADELQPADVAEEHPLPVEDSTAEPETGDLSELELRLIVMLNNDDESRPAMRMAREIARHREMVKRLEEWAEQLETVTVTAVGSVANRREFAAELRNRMRGAK